jgi:hypothetical protein
MDILLKLLESSKFFSSIYFFEKHLSNVLVHISVSFTLKSVCYLKEGPCGGIASGAPMTSMQGGQPYNVLFQQNLNHFYLGNPGKLVVDFATNADPVEGDFVQLGEPVADYNAVRKVIYCSVLFGCWS